MRKDLSSSVPAAPREARPSSIAGESKDVGGISRRAGPSLQPAGAEALPEGIFGAILDSFDHVVWAAHSDGRIFYMNRAWERWTGRTVRESLGHAWADAIHPDDAAPMLAAWRSACEQSTLHSGECRFKAADGSDIVASFVGRPFRDASGEVTHWFGIDLDVTDLRRAQSDLDQANRELRQKVEQLESARAALEATLAERTLAEEAIRASEARYADLYESAPDMYLSVDADTGAILGCNRAVSVLTGYTKQDLVGRPVSVLYEGDATERALAELGQARDVGATESTVRREDGTTFPAVLSASAVRDPAGRVLEYRLSWRDLSALDHARRLERQAAALARSNAELEQFAYVASHDLQEPLRMVASYLELLAKRYRGKLDEKADKFIGYAVDGAQRMQRLLVALLEYSRVEQRAGAKSSIESTEALADAVRNLEVAIRESGGAVTHGPLPTVVADHAQLVQLFQNLVGNGLKFRATDVAPRVHVTATRQDDGWVFSVKDNGIGIARQFADRIFGVFQRLHARDKYEGTGIGLAVSKRIVERHGGRIWVESEPGEGATFRFELPDGDACEATSDAAAG